MKTIHPEHRMRTNKEYAKDNKEFKDACEKVGVEPTKRQASKWRMNKGKAFNFADKN